MAKTTTSRNVPKAATPGARDSAKANTNKSPPKRSNTKRATAKAGDANVNKIVAKIRKLQDRECKHRRDIVQRQLEVGAELNILKETVPHGSWSKLRDGLGYEERMAQKLMKLAAEKFGDKIRDIEPDFARRLPTDLFKLDILNRLSKVQLKDSLKAWGSSLERMDRAKLRAAVDGVLKPSEVKEPKSTASGAGTAEESESPSQTQLSAARATSSVASDDSATTSGASAGDGNAKPTTGTSLIEFQTVCCQITARAPAIAEAIKGKQISKESAEEAVAVLNDATRALNDVKKRLARIK